VRWAGVERKPLAINMIIIFCQKVELDSELCVNSSIRLDRLSLSESSALIAIAPDLLSISRLGHAVGETEASSYECCLPTPAFCKSRLPPIARPPRHILQCHSWYSYHSSPCLPQSPIPSTVGGGRHFLIKVSTWSISSGSAEWPNP
jgi:hypothetical protein